MVTENMAAPVVVRAGEDRHAASLKFLNGRFDCKISGSDTGGALCAYDTWRFKPCLLYTSRCV